MANSLYQGVLSFAILSALGIWIYSNLKGQSAKDTIIELKELWQTATSSNE